jgi:hypothetical protein
MRRLSRILVVAVAVTGLALIGSAVQGLAAVDGRLAEATKQQRQEHMRDVRQLQRPEHPNCPRLRPSGVDMRAL